MKRISLRQVLLLHDQLLEGSGGSAGVRDIGLLESALAVPYQEFAGVSNYPSLEEKAVRLGFGIIKNHPFVDGNKRTGAHLMLLLLYINEIELEYVQDELIDTILAVAEGSLDYDGFLAWTKNHRKEHSVNNAEL